MLHFFRTFKTLSIHRRAMPAFIQNLNPITGQNEWVVQSENYDYHQEVARAAFADMLHDTERNVLYDKALKVAIDRVHSRGQQANVLDIGTGTGLLSMMAVRNGADKVVACEAFEPMSKCAGEVIRLNGYKDKIHIIPKRSTDLKVGVDLDERCNILVTEVFDTELIGEGALQTFKHAHETLLTKDCISVPTNATCFVQVIESPIVNNWNKLKDVYDDHGSILLTVPPSMNQCPGSASLHDVQLSQLPKEFLTFLTEPLPMFRFDWSGKTPIVMERSNIIQGIAKNGGQAHGVFFWWELAMDVDQRLVLSCAPKWAHPQGATKIPWRDHWMQAIYYFPEPLVVKPKETLHVIGSHDEYSLWFNAKKSLKITEEDYKLPVCSCGLHITYSRTRIGQLNDSLRTKKYLNLIENNINSTSVVLILSHGFYIGLTAAKIAQQVFIYEPNCLSRGIIQDFVIENKLTNVRLIEDHKDLDTETLKINVVLGEPYFISSILPWDNMLFVYLLDKFRPYLSEGVSIFPAQMTIKGVAMQFDDLHKIRAPLGTCEGFKMRPFDNLIKSSSKISDEKVEAQPLWEYPGRALTAPQDLASIDLRSITAGFKARTKGAFALRDRSRCNGVAFWCEWTLDPDVKSVVSTGPTRAIRIDDYVKWDMHSRQGVCLLDAEGAKGAAGVLGYSFMFDYDKGSVTFTEGE